MVGMDAGRSAVYHTGMDDLRDELAGLVADVASSLEALRLQGVILLPVAAAESRPLVEDSPRPTRAAPAPRAATIVPAARHAPAPAPPAPAAAGGLLGRWAEQLVGPDERLEAAIVTLGEACVACGEPTVRGTGALRSGLVLVADPCTEAEASVLSNMLLKVVGVEPDDVWRVTPRRCHGCVDGLRVLVEAIRPRVMLVLGQTSTTATELVRGEWGSFGGVSAIATWHPGEIGADVARKRPAFEALQAVARRR